VRTEARHENILVPTDATAFYTLLLAASTVVLALVTLRLATITKNSTRDVLRDQTVRERKLMYRSAVAARISARAIVEACRTRLAIFRKDLEQFGYGRPAATAGTELLSRVLQADIATSYERDQYVELTEAIVATQEAFAAYSDSHQRLEAIDRERARFLHPDNRNDLILWFTRQAGRPPGAATAEQRARAAYEAVADEEKRKVVAPTQIAVEEANQKLIALNEASWFHAEPSE
jgi:hypothetical protein